MDCGKAFYHWSIIACIKGMNLCWINKRQHTPTERQMCVPASTCTHIYTSSLQRLSCRLSLWKNGGIYGSFPPPCLPLPPPTHTHTHTHTTANSVFLSSSLLSSLMFSSAIFLLVHLSVSLSMPECKVRITKGTPGKHGCGPPHLIVTPPTPTPPPLTPFSKRHSQEWQTRLSAAGGRRKRRRRYTPLPSPPLTPFIPLLPPQLAFHTPGSAIQTRSCMYMFLSTSNTSLLSLSLWVHTRVCVCAQVCFYALEQEKNERNR